MAMKRKDMILAVSLALFNEEGEANLSAVDIANELDISPGNLYYHFKGKEEIIVALYGQFEGGITLLLDNVRNAGDSLEEHWLHLYVLLELLYEYRFFFRNVTDLLQKYSIIANRFHRLIEQQYQSIRAMLCLLLQEADTEVSKLSDSAVDELADTMMLIYIHWFEFQHLRKRVLDKDSFVQSAIHQITMLLAPYLSDQKAQFMAESNALYWQNRQG